MKAKEDVAKVVQKEMVFWAVDQCTSLISGLISVEMEIKATARTAMGSRRGRETVGLLHYQQQQRHHLDQPQQQYIIEDTVCEAFAN